MASRKNMERRKRADSEDDTSVSSMSSSSSTTSASSYSQSTSPYSSPACSTPPSASSWNPSISDDSKHSDISDVTPPNCTQGIDDDDATTPNSIEDPEYNTQDTKGLDPCTQFLTEAKAELAIKRQAFGTTMAIVFNKLAKARDLQLRLNELKRAKNTNLSTNKTDSIPLASDSNTNIEDKKVKLKIVLVRKEANFWEVKKPQEELTGAKLSHADILDTTSVSTKDVSGSKAEPKIKNEWKAELAKYQQLFVSSAGGKSHPALSETSENSDSGEHKSEGTMALQQQDSNKIFTTPEKQPIRVSVKANTDPPIKRKESLESEKMEDKLVEKVPERKVMSAKSSATKKPRRKLFYNSNVKHFFKQ